jgi:hypothetical protein
MAANSKKQFSGRKIEKKKIELNGQAGQFNIDNKRVKVRYFSTFASGSNESHDSLSLLRELKPMRERVKANQISNLDSLLQRDLNDYRVANELIPYLTNEKSPVAFFPAILAVLIPKGFIQQNEEADYPVAKKTETKSSLKLEYGDLWDLETFTLGDKPSSLGILTIDQEEVDIIVLDGQHRANAFRAVTGTFDTASLIYSIFYEGVQTIPNFNADLPVTIIWFDNDKPKFDPKIVSRRLFVDVNNNAKKVSQSRTILLDEYEIPSLMTRFFYSYLADKNKFSTSELSMFHADFDLDSDINVSSNNAFAITNPQIIYDIHSWLTLGRTEQYSALHRYDVSREAFRNSVLRFGEIFKTTAFSDQMIDSDEESSGWKRVVIKDPYKIELFETAYKQVLAPVLFGIFSNFNFYEKHFEACKIVNEGKMDYFAKSVWEEVFLGGEGLYYTFKDKNLKQSPLVDFDKYLGAISSLEQKLEEQRAKLFIGIDEKKVTTAFNSANSKAFQIGLFLALDVFRDNQLPIDAYESFVGLLNDKSAEDWVYILTDIRQKVIKGVDPKKWPAYQNIILRAIQGDDETYYDNDNFEASPDFRVFRDEIDDSFNSWLDQNNDIDIDDIDIDTVGKTTIDKWSAVAEANYQALFQKANIPNIKDVDHKVLGRKVVIALIEKLKK